MDLLFFDTTSTYFQTDTPDPDQPADDGEPTPGFRRFGKSKDHRDDLPQVVIGLAVTREGIPVRVWCWSGNTNDQSVLEQVKDDLRTWKLGRVITVVDRGFSSASNLAYLRRAGGHYLAGMRMRDGNPLVEQVLSRQGRYQDVRDNLRVKEIHFDQADGTRFILCHNPRRRPATRHGAPPTSTVSRPNSPGSPSSALVTATASSPTPPEAVSRKRMSGPNARYATTPRSAGGYARPRKAGSRSTAPR